MIQPQKEGPRILLYSHDSFGLGHLRRSLTLSEGLLDSFPQAQLLIVTGSPTATLFEIPARAGLVKLPSVTKNDDGSHVPRTFGSSLKLLRRIRQGLLLESFRAFRPDLIIVDHKVIGWHGEAVGLLEAARAGGVRTLLGVHDIIDSSEAVAREWGDDKTRWALAEGYDSVCVYGVPEVFDPRIEYPTPPEFSERVEFTGYVANRGHRYHRSPVPAMRPQVLVTTGGGEDGARLLNIYLEGIEGQKAPWDTVLVSGPLLDDSEARRIRRRARMIGNVEVRRFYADMPRLLSDCDAVVSMAGYNTCTEVMQSGKPWVLLPRTHPRMEQAIRADRLSKLGLAVRLADPKPGYLRLAVRAALDRVRMPVDPIPSLDGVQRVCAIAADLLEVPLTLSVAARKRRTQKAVS